jgi:cyclic pyranopterin phosphate synthase
MPQEEYTWLPSASILSFAEIEALVDAFVRLRVHKLRITGGEPLLRPGLADLVARLTAKAEIGDVAMTTNGVLLARYASQLRRAGLHRVTVSLDTLRPDRFAHLSRRTNHSDVMEGIQALADAGFVGTKLDTVVIRGTNDDELIDLVEFARAARAEIRFIEYMDVPGAIAWSSAKVFPQGEILATLGRHYGPIEPIGLGDAAPANRYRLPDGLVFGIIASTTQPFCGTCNRSRLTADGMWFRCLYAQSGTDLRSPLRGGASTDELVRLVSGLWGQRVDQGAVDRRRDHNRGVLFGVDALRRDPHLEMHTRGG